MWIENDVMLTARLHGHGAFGALILVVYVRKTVSVGCDGVRVCGRELCSRSPRLQNLWDASVGEELPCKKDSGNEKDPYAVAVMRSSIIVSQVLGRYQLLARFFWQIRDRGTIVVCARERRYKTPPTHTIDCNDIMTKYWRNLIWRCVHNPPNCQIEFPAKFSGHTVHLCIYVHIFLHSSI